MSDDGNRAQEDTHSNNQEGDAQDSQQGGRGRGRGGASGDKSGRGSSKRNDDACVYVANMSFRTTWQALKDIMRDAGDVQLVELVVDGTGRPKGAALVTFGAREEAQKACKNLNGTVVDGRDILVRMYEKGQRPAVAAGNYTREQLARVGAERKNFTGGRGGGAEHQQQGQQGQRGSGEDDDYRKQGRDNRRNDYHQQQGGRGGEGQGGKQGRGGDWTVQDGGDFNRRNLETFGEDYRRGGGNQGGAQGGAPNQAGGQPALAQPRHAQPPPGTKLFISNLPFDCNWKTLKDTFAQIGTVMRADIISDDRGRSRGMGTVIFERAGDAATAIEEFDGVHMGDRPMGVRYDRPKQ